MSQDRSNKSNLTCLRVDVTTAGLRLDKALATLTEIGSRSRAEQLLNSGRIRMVSRAGAKPLLSEKKIKTSLKVEEGDIFEIEIVSTNSSKKLKSLNLPLDILFEDDDLIVINKPAGLVMHPAAGHQDDTLVNALLHHTSSLSMAFGEDRPGIVHRLDRDTSGVLVVAKNDFTHRALSAQFQKRSVHRIYWALVFGHPKKEEGRIETFLKRHPRDRKRFASSKSKSGKIAITNYKVVTSRGEVSLIHCKLETGRTHQIRVHLSEMGHPILGDKIYGGDRRLKNIKAKQLRDEIKNLKRIGLHAAELAFEHPRTKQTMRFSQSWPEDLANLF